jgi:hypothetical protein
MAINGVRSPPGGAPHLSPAAQGEAEPDKTRSPTPRPGDAQQSDLPDRSPSRAREGAIPPRAALAMLASVQAAADGTPATPEAIAAKVRAQVNAGKVPLRTPHTDAVLRAALLAAARGLTVLGKDFRQPVGK